MEQDAAIGRRLRAARELAGLRSVEALAERINAAGLGVKTLRGIEQGRREPERRELWEIAEACGVPLDFFTADTQSLGAGRDGDQLAEIVERLDAIDRKLNQLLASADTPEAREAAMAQAISRLGSAVREEVLAKGTDSTPGKRAARSGR